MQQTNNLPSSTTAPITVKIESTTLNGEVLFDKESDLLSFLKAIRKDAVHRSKPKTHRNNYWRTQTQVATEEHKLKIEIITNVNN
jgi:hypothetical protein